MLKSLVVTNQSSTFRVSWAEINQKFRVSWEEINLPFWNINSCCALALYPPARLLSSGICLAKILYGVVFQIMFGLSEAGMLASLTLARAS